MNKEDILNILKHELPYLKNKFNVKNIGLFGSYIRSEQTKQSDIDLLVEFSAPIGFFKFIDLENYLSDKFGLKIDLVPIDALKPLIKPSILKETIYA
ncbi:MAG: nucleotidyltransferase [Candidatus Lokiarchaeota archaeon]|nr:nucleotidyltransferase [Candidatus Lokiarchaeota archaeon]